MTNKIERDELATLIGGVSMEAAYADADAILAAGYRKVDHIEYAADHLHASVLEFQDEDGNLWTDKAAIREYLDEFQNVTLVRRHVTTWEPTDDG